MTGLWIVVSVVCVFAGCVAQFEGDSCTLDSGDDGKCITISDCPSALDLIKKKGRPQTCSFDGRTPIVCCPSQNGGTATSRKSIEKCNEYYEPSKVKLVNNSVIDGILSVVGGKPSLAKEFPHMTAIGYGELNDTQWLCGGSLISEKFVLTAAHCVISQEYGSAKFARLGDLDIKSTSDDAQPEDFSIVQTFVHPDFRPPSHYNDIALFRLDKIVQFSLYIKPACLQVDPELPEVKFQATGWGRTEYFGEPSSQLMKVDLGKIILDDCRKQYSNISPRRLSNGIRDDVQICAGDQEGKDTCAGDSGGPLQYRSTSPYAFRIVGITSFGKACGIGKTAGVYTRVSFYVDWIENIVWPE